MSRYSHVAGQAQHLESDAWRPDARASLGLGAAAALLVMVCFTALFSAVAPLKLSQPAAGVREELVLAEPTPVRSRPISHVPAPRRVLPVQLPELQRMPAPVPLLRAPDSFSIQNYLDERARDNAAALRDQVTGSDLKRKLGKPAEQQALPDAQGYQTAGGQKVVRSGSGCAQIQTVQGSSSPTNRINIAEPTSCPGGTPDAGREIGKALDDWAKQHAPPPYSIGVY